MKQPYLYILFFVLLASVSNGQQKTTTMNGNQQAPQESRSIMAEPLHVFDKILNKTADGTVYLTEIYQNGPINNPPMEDIDKVEFSISYRLRVESNDGLCRVERECVAQFMREEGGRRKLMEAVFSSISFTRQPSKVGKEPAMPEVVHKSVIWLGLKNDSLPVVPQWRFVGYADDSTLYAVRVLSYLKSSASAEWLNIK